jgi:hypothetical protein
MQFAGNEGRRKAQRGSPMEEADEQIPHLHGCGPVILDTISIRLLHTSPEKLTNKRTPRWLSR